MFKHKYFFLSSILFLFVIIFLLNHSFSSVEKTYNSDIEEFNCAITELEDIVKPEVDYKLLLGNKLNNFESKIDYRAKVNRFQGVVLVAFKNQVIFEKAYGYEDPIHKKKLSKDASFELASVSKQFTAASILKLSEQGKIDLDKPIKAYFPDFKFENVTIQNLLKHSSGLWDYMYLTEAYWSKSHAPNNCEIIELINNHQSSLSFRPGSRFRYNNTNYALLVTLVEKIRGQTFESYLQDNFFQPFCLENTYVGVQSRKLQGVISAFQPYRRGFIKLPPSFHNSALGDKGIHATANDLWLWFKALKNYQSISQESIDKMFNLDSYNDYEYGMGFRTQQNRVGELEIYHDGLWDGFRNGLHYFPEKELTFIVLSHTQNKGKTYFQNYLEKYSKNLINILEKEKLSGQKL